jgi:hydroxymethylbilane synthase
MKIVIATRKSQLALWQAEYICERIKLLDASIEVILLPMSTQGDKILDVPLAKIGGKGLFLKELENALLENRADIAVHSMKDVPMEFPQGLQLTAICEREDPRDAFVSNHFENFQSLPQGARVGTSSLRRKAQLAYVRPDLNFIDLRGNIHTRMKKLDEGNYDAIILAAAGLLRVNQKERIKEYLSEDICLPAGGQGAIGIESRSSDKTINGLLEKLTDGNTWDCVMAERALNTKLKGGCQVPIAAFAKIEKNILSIKALVASTEGKEILFASESGERKNAWKIGEQAANSLLEQGAERLLAPLGLKY